MSSFYVTSQNRNAVRRLLVSTGLPAADVRNWPTSKLGATLRQLVTDTKVTMEAAQTACKVEDRDYEFVPAGEQPPIPVPMPPPPAILLTKEGDERAAALANAIGNAVQHALSTMPQGLDVDKVLEVIQQDWNANRVGRIVEVIQQDWNANRVGLIARMIADAGIRPAIVEIVTDGKSKRVEGRKHKEFETLVRIVNTRVQGRRLHAWLVGPSGSGKSYLAAQVAEAVELPFYSTGAIQSKYDLIGFVSPTGNESTLRTPFRDAFEKGGVFSWDDCDASDPRAFVAFNEALSNGRFAFPDKCITQHADFVAVASANTWGNGATSDYVGRNKIDAATLSRFVRIEVDYDEAMERDLVGPENAEWSGFVQNMRRAVSKCGVKVLVTPRATLQGAALLKAGVSRSRVEAMTVFAGVDKETESKIRKAA
jgi:cobaltochelatase CobS